MIAFSALIVSIGGAVTTFVLYWLSGARLKVQMVFGYRDQVGKTVTYPTFPTRKRRPSWKTFEQHALPLGIEYAVVRVTNIGRTPVSVENISLDLGRAQWRTRRRNLVTPRHFAVPRVRLRDTPEPELK